MTALIRFENIQKGFKNRIILNDLNFEIQKGEIFGIIGMSGSGKTTLLNTIIGFLEPEQGEISFYSEKHKKFESISKHQREIRKKLGFSTQAASFYPKMTVSYHC